MSELDWRAIRNDYENGMSLRNLTEKYGVPKSVIGRKKFKEQWDQRDRGTPLDTQSIPNRDVNAATRVAMALKLRAQKLTYEEIANRTGYGSASACRKAIQRELQRILNQSVEEMRSEELYMLNQLHAAIYPKALDTANKGQLFAVDRVFAISERRSKLMGLDTKPDDLPPGVTVIREYGVEVSKV